MASRGNNMSYIPLFQPAPVVALSPSNSSGSSKTTVPLGPSSSLSSSMSSIWAPVTPNSAGAQWPDALPIVSPHPARAPTKVAGLDMGQNGYVTLKVADGADKIKAAIEHSQHLVVEQLLRSLHIDSPEPVVDSAVPTAIVSQPRRWSPDPLSASSGSSPSALATPDNLSPMLPPTLDDYFASHQSQLIDQLPQMPVTPPNMNQFDHVGLYSPTKPLRSSQSQAQLAQQEFIARNARGRSLSVTTTQAQGFSPFALPASSPSSQSVLFRSHPLAQDQQQQQPVTAHDFTTVHRSQFRHVSMPNALSQASPPVQENWIRTSGPVGAGLSMAQQQPVFQNPFGPHVMQQQVTAGQYSPTGISALAPQAQQTQLAGNESINFLRLLQPSSQPPYDLFVQRIVRSSDQQASIFLQQKLKVADAAERTKIVDAIASKGFEMMTNRFGNWCCQRVWEYPDERAKLVSCMRGRVVDIATNCYGTHVLQKALDCDDETRLVIVSELLLNDPASTLVNKHASHVFSKIMEINWKDPAPPIFSYFHNALRGKWASLACHETGSLVVQHVFENVDDEDPAKDEIVCELIAGFGDIVKNQFGAFCVQHLLEHGSPKHRTLALDQLMEGLLEYASHEQGVKSIQKALKEGGGDILDRMCKRMCEPPIKGGRRSLIVDLALNPTGSQLIANILPNVNKEQRTMLYEAIRRHVVTLRGSKTGSKTVWLFDRMRAYYGFGPGN